ncbi:glycerophosphodiester phosphodiesterase [Pinibacter soli]|uniref:Glycerophosphodiester phosphodiesterase n=1 Tax=Pinibacter soli TaxID=3044211 RepID=A0ABT6RGU7_9BACT|nr:glycerophosphodiester phosphodiesterase [Pinibacter soli]MDI3321785.1 glycerophosphodiester phosphodiesterase [Pinibacter soli]
MSIDTLPAFDLEGHRGGRGLMPENTIPAMLHAIDLGVTTLEMDVVFTKDMQPILSHEPFFNHDITTKPDGSFVTEKEQRSLNIYTMNYDSVKRYDVGLKPHPKFPEQKKMPAVKPLLTDVIDRVETYLKKNKKKKVFYNIETKTNKATDNIYHPEPAAFVDALMLVLIQKKITSRVIIQSFDFRTLEYLKTHYPSMKTALLIEDYDKKTFKEQLALAGFKPTIYSPAYKLVTRKLVEDCHSKNIKVIPWTVNDKAIYDSLVAKRVDGVITDYPDRIR